MSRVLEDLRRVRYRVAGHTWTQMTGARDADGIPIDPTQPGAVAWCVYGATTFEGAGSTEDRMDELLEDKAVELFSATPDEVNDKLGRLAVLRLIDAVILDLEVADGPAN